MLAFDELMASVVFHVVLMALHRFPLEASLRWMVGQSWLMGRVVCCELVKEALLTRAGERAMESKAGACLRGELPCGGVEALMVSQ